MARQRRQHACLSECAIAQSIALGCQITLEWTAATSMSTPSVCHDATIRVSHHTLSGTQGGEGRKRGQRRREKGEREREDSHFCCLLRRTCSFYPVPQPTWENIKCINTPLGDKIPQPSSATLDKYPRHISLT